MAKKYKRPRDTRLAIEYDRVETLANRSSKISFKVLHETRHTKLPDVYEITYKVKSIIGINDKKEPVYGNEHKLKLTLPPRWPASDSPPEYYMLTDTWHPNIKSDEPYKGHVCINSKAISGYEGIDDLVIRIAELLQFKNYLAEDKPPYPEDPVVAEWVREFAEPKGIISMEKGIAVDDSDLLEPVEDTKVFDETTGGNKSAPEEIEIIIEDEPDKKDPDISFDFT